MKIERPAWFEWDDSVANSRGWCDKWFTEYVQPINEMLADGIEVTGYGDAARIWQGAKYHDHSVTHQALLIQIQPIKKETPADVLREILNNALLAPGSILEKKALDALENQDD